MAEVSRIVRERLRGQVTAGEHPDANLLSAFAERTLTEQERAQVLDHLSRCADCRQVVTLSAPPEVEEERRVAAAVVGRASATASRSWWRSPIVHWGALTAAALVVLIAVGERMRLREGHSASAPAVATYETAQQVTKEPPKVSAAPSEQKHSDKLAGRARSRKSAMVGPPRQPTVVGSGAGGGVGSGMGGGIGSGVAGGVVGGRITPQSGAAPSVAVENAPPALPVPAAPAMKRQVDAGQYRGPSVAGREANEAAATPTVKSEAAPLSRDQIVLFAKRASLSPRWSISDSGALQRSLDGGRSWKEVAVAEGVSFRAVAKVGNEVWAGGLGGALFHSTDGGEHWARVRVQANGHALSGDIVRIEFTDTADGVLATSSGETWTTSDAGVTWQR